jgi:hypothetical protein
MRGGGTPEYGEMKLGTFVELLYVINHATFYSFLTNTRLSGTAVFPFEMLRQHCLALPRWGS